MRAVSKVLWSLPQNSPVTVPIQQEELVQCSQCELRIRATHMLAHMHKKHGYTNPLRRKVGASVCMSCHKQFWTRPRLFQHVARRSNFCKVFYESHMPELEYEHWVHVESEERELLTKLRGKGLSCRYSAVPVVRLQGPLRPMASG